MTANRTEPVFTRREPCAAEAEPDRLGIRLGIQALDWTSLQFDRTKGTVRVVRHKLLNVRAEEFRLAAVLDVYAGKRRSLLFTRYYVVLAVLGKRLQFVCLSRAQGKRAAKEIRAFLGAPSP